MRIVKRIIAAIMIISGVLLALSVLASLSKAFNLFFIAGLGSSYAWGFLLAQVFLGLVAFLLIKYGAKIYKGRKNSSAETESW